MVFDEKFRWHCSRIFSHTHLHPHTNAVVVSDGWNVQEAIRCRSEVMSHFLFVANEPSRLVRNVSRLAEGIIVKTAGMFDATLFNFSTILNCGCLFLHFRRSYEGKFAIRIWSNFFHIWNMRVTVTYTTK